MTIKQQGGVFGRHPEFSSVEIDGVGTIQRSGSNLKIVAAGGVEIEGSYQFDLLVKGGVQIDDERLRVRRSANTSYAEIGVDATSAYLKSTYSSGGTSDFRFLRNSSEIMRITGNGITFNGDTAAANALDDYEEGTWTPEFSITGGSFSAITYSGRTGGWYTKWGNTVHISGYIATDSLTVGTDGTLRIGGLPFASAGTGLPGFSERPPAYIGTADNWGTSTPIGGFVYPSSTLLFLHSRSAVDGASSSTLASNMGTTSQDNELAFAATYTVD